MAADRANWPPFFRNLYSDNGTPFRAARLKLMRAEHHLEELRIAARVLPQSMPQKFAIGTKPDKAFISFMAERMPLQFSALLGDTTHNLRCVFDYVAVALTAPPIGAGKHKDALFPTGVDQLGYTKARAEKMAGANRDGLKIIDSLEPWRDGKYGLRSLHELDILDKHKLLVPSIASMTIRNLQATFRGQPMTITQANFQSSPDSTSFYGEVDCPGIDSGDEFKFTGSSFDATFEVVFAHGQPFAGQPIVPTMERLRNVAANLIDQCEKTFPGFTSWTVAAHR